MFGEDIMADGMAGPPASQAGMANISMMDQFQMGLQFMVQAAVRREDDKNTEVMEDDNTEAALQEETVHSTEEQNGGGRKMDKKLFKDKCCLVCGDKALGYNFNAVTCESCKAFFRRNAFRDIWGRCDGKCNITLETRSYCKKCRLKKCFSIGMKRDLILNERQKEERRIKIKENRTRRHYGPDVPLAVSGQTSHNESSGESSDASPLPGPSTQTLLRDAIPAPPATLHKPIPFTHQFAGDVNLDNVNNVSEPSKNILLEVIEAFRVSFDAPIEKNIVQRPSNVDFLNMADASVRRLVKMSKKLSGFKRLSQEDQVAILKGAVLEVLVLRSVKMFDSQSMQWNIPKSGNMMPITPEMVQKMNSESLGFMRQYQMFAVSVMSAVRQDSMALMMLIVLCVLSPDRQGIKDKTFVATIQEEHANALKEYIRVNFPRDRVMFARVLQKLADIRDLHEVHSRMLQNTNLNDLEPLMVEMFDVGS